MKNNNTSKLALRAHSIRMLTPTELRAAQGGDGNHAITTFHCTLGSHMPAPRAIASGRH